MPNTDVSMRRRGRTQARHSLPVKVDLQASQRLDRGGLSIMQMIGRGRLDFGPADQFVENGLSPVVLLPGDPEVCAKPLNFRLQAPDTACVINRIISHPINA